MDFYSKALKNLPNADKTKNGPKERRRCLLYLILSYLEGQGYQNTADILKKEAYLDDIYQICDNVDLDMILQEYQSYFYVKFQRHPTILKRINDTEQRSVKNNSAKGVRSKKSVDNQPEKADEFQFDIKSISNIEITEERPIMFEENADEVTRQILSQVVPKNNDINWDHCIGLEDIAETLKESCVYPVLHPELFQNLTAWSGVLLYGPPGTGKTLLAKTLASEAGMAFFNVTNSTFTSKWRGDSEKMIKSLFDLAEKNSPSVIFFDEIDAIVPGNGGHQHEATKRFRSEILTQMDGIMTEDSKVFILAATNSPWELDGALLRRFDKKILVPLPGKQSRVAMLKKLLENCSNGLTGQDFQEFGNLTRWFSGSDIKTFTKELRMVPIREKINGKTASIRKINSGDLRKALEKVKPSAGKATCTKYDDWANEFGSW